MINSFIREKVFPYVMITLGAVLAAFALEEFLIPSTILDGGITGISIIINQLSGIQISIIIVVLNIPFLVIGFKQLGKEFLIKGIYGMLLFSVMLTVFKDMENVTETELLAVVFGGVLLGVGVGIVLRYGGCLDGTEIVAMLLSKKMNFSTGQIIFFINIAIYILAGILFGWDRAMYSLLTYFISFKVIDMVEEGMEQAKAAMIITNEAEGIAKMIYDRLGRTCTILEGEGLISGKKTVLYCVITRIEINGLKRIINEHDGSAFVTITDVAEIIGNHIKNYSSGIN
ncbi:MAG: YitT family protein [bacterium]|nr:YitT family protein [bacterium]